MEVFVFHHYRKLLLIFRGGLSLNPNHRKRELFTTLKDDNYQQELKRFKNTYPRY